MAATKGNGLDAANDQPAKNLTKHTAYFIAMCMDFANRIGAVNVELFCFSAAIVWGLK